jgi:predicted dehydrogenase
MSRQRSNVQQTRSIGETINIAVVGCGAIVEQQHLPSLARLAAAGRCQVTTLVERDRARAERLAERFGIPEILTDHHDLFARARGRAQANTQAGSGPNVDAVVVGLPNHLHASIGIELLEIGLHMLVEKPVANTVADCDAMIAAAKKTGVTLAVGHMRRFAHAGRYAKWAIDSGLLGRIRSFDIQNGFVYAWPVTTDYLWHKEKAGGGVLIDLGVHTLDQMLWWLGDVQSFTYYDDNYGGVEADCKIEVTLESGAEGIVQISRTRDLRETAIIRGERAELEVGLVSNTVSLRFYRDTGGQTTSARMGIIGHADLAQGSLLSADERHPREHVSHGFGTSAEQKVADLVAAEHIDFIEAIRTGHPPAVSGIEARRSLALVEACYANRHLWELPWVELCPTGVKKPTQAEAGLVDQRTLSASVRPAMEAG